MEDEKLLRDIRQLIEELHAVASALDMERDHESMWADWFLRCADRLAQKDLGGAEMALKAFGGMGSVSDLVVDGKVRERLETIYRVAYDVRREAVRRGLL